MPFDSARADRITAFVFFVLGAAMTWGGYVMDRLEIRQIHPASIPGLVPMFLGVALMLCRSALSGREDRPCRRHGRGGGIMDRFFGRRGLECFLRPRSRRKHALPGGHRYLSRRLHRLVSLA